MAAPTEEQLADRARFVFRGTVESARAPHARDVPSTAATVRVDEVVQGPAKLMMFAGREVFVIPCPRERFRAGERAIFYTNALVFGDTLTLESVGHRPLAAGTIGVRSTPHPASALRTRDVQKRLATADLVVVGRVAAVRLPPASRRAPARTKPSPPVSEHDPEWRDAVIDVERVAKGSSGRKQVIVRFPASHDVRWFRAPKLSAGDEGVFILHRTGALEAAPASGARAVSGPSAPVFTALHPQDVQPADMQDDIAALLQRAPSTRGTTAPARPARSTRSVKTTGRKAGRRRRSPR